MTLGRWFDRRCVRLGLRHCSTVGLPHEWFGCREHRRGVRKCTSLVVDDQVDSVGGVGDGPHHCRTEHSGRHGREIDPSLAVSKKGGSAPETRSLGDFVPEVFADEAPQLDRSEFRQSFVVQLSPASDAEAASAGASALPRRAP